jgi:hypothetical protein
VYQSSTLSQHDLYSQVLDIKNDYDAQCGGENKSDNSILVLLKNPNVLAT